MIDQHQIYRIEAIDSDKVIWRYLDLWKLEKMLSDRSLYFARSDKVNDRKDNSLEGSYTLEDIKNDCNILRKLLNNDSKVVNILNSNRSFRMIVREYVYINCWYSGNCESRAMWNLYAPQGVLIKSKIKNLTKSIEDNKKTFCFAFVKYIDYEKDKMKRGGNFLEPYCYKPLEDESEKEFRVFILKEFDYPFKKNLGSEGDNIKVNIEKLIEKIVYNSDLNERQYKKLEKLVKEYNLTKKLSRSSLDKVPLF